MASYSKKYIAIITIFYRKVGGFVYVVSVLMSMEGCLSPKNQALYNRRDEENLFLLLRSG